MEQRLVFDDPDGQKVSAVLRTPAMRTDKVVVLCHGFMGYKDSWTNRMLSERLEAECIATMRFDFFGHGQSGGDLKDLLVSTLVRQTERAVAFVRGHGFDRVGLLGSSFGGLVATLTAAKDAALAALALRCPVVDFPALLQQRFGRLAIEVWRRAGRVPASIAEVPVHFRFYEDCLRHDAGRAAEQLRVPTSIVHGGRDEVIPVAQAKDLYRRIPADKELHIIPEADHRFSRSEHFADMRDRLAGWLVRHLTAGALA
jgi:pimeloyl-ACP methyl ester carboxylesterase